MSKNTQRHKFLESILLDFDDILGSKKGKAGDYLMKHRRHALARVIRIMTDHCPARAWRTTGRCCSRGGCGLNA